MTKVSNLFICIDLYLMYRVFEPMMRRLQKWSGHNNFWWARQFIAVSHVLLFVYALFLTIYTDMKLAGMLGVFCVMIGISVLSIKLWRLLIKRTKWPKLRHFTQRECDNAMYYAYYDMRNPLELRLLHARLRRYLELCVIMIMTGITFYLKSEYLLVCGAVLYHIIVITMWVYMRSCTPRVK